jgi:hypothetical protein
LELKFSYDYRITEDTNAAFVLRDVVYPRGAGFLGWIALALSPIDGCTRRAYLVTAAGFPSCSQS